METRKVQGNSNELLQIQNFPVLPDGVEVLDDRTPSGRKIDWRGRKMANEYLALAYESFDPRKALRLRDCSTFLAYAMQEGERKLRAANFCRLRLCPICQWRRSLKLFGQMQQVLQYLEPKEYSFIFLTLTMSNVYGDGLGDALDQIVEAFRRFMQYKEIKAVAEGWYRGLEVTHNLDRSSKNFDTFHPHLHVIIAVKKNYFKSSKYLSQARFTALWQRALCVKYTPVVDVRRVKGNTAKAVCEATKYAAKSKDYLVLDDWDLTVETVKLLDEVLFNRRLIGFGGVLRDARHTLNQEDVETGDLIITNQDEQYAKDEYYITYAWHSGYCQYIRDT